MLPIVHIVDDDASFRASTSRLLRACGYAVEVYESAEQLLTRLPDDPGANCIILDIKMPGVDGPELQNRLNAIGSALPVIFLTGHADVPTTVQVIKAGADDLLTKPVEKDALLEAIRRALTRGRTVLAKREQKGPLRALASHLSPRERQVFERVVRGKMNKEIARELGTTERTIKAHRHHVMEKMKVTSLAELVMVAERLGVLAVGSETPTGEVARPENPPAGDDK
jgi:FixJ family two-component response regulator